MVKYEDIDDNFDFSEEKKKGKVKTIFRTTVLFLVFLLVILFIISNDYSFAVNFNDNNQQGLEAVCGEDDKEVMIGDEELQQEKVKQVITANQAAFKQLPGFERVLIKEQPIGYRGSRRLVIELIFEGAVSDQVKLPERLCGFKLEAVYH